MSIVYGLFSFRYSIYRYCTLDVMYLDCTVLWLSAQYSIVAQLYSTVQYCTVLYSTCTSVLKVLTL